MSIQFSIGSCMSIYSTSTLTTYHLPILPTWAECGQYDQYGKAAWPDSLHRLTHGYRYHSQTAWPLASSLESALAQFTQKPTISYQSNWNYLNSKPKPRYTPIGPIGANFRKKERKHPKTQHQASWRLGQGRLGTGRDQGQRDTMSQDQPGTKTKAMA